ncbi:MAG TPA: hypothetical protein VGU20_15265 [Stellaceae bacterium]|nr:hypothetical protein [Stellaceae bacterium]
MIVLPLDPLAVPGKERAESAFEVLRALRPKADEHELHLSDAPQFFHCGGNYETVFCPLCETDIGDWALGAIGAWWESADRRALLVETPCCSRSTSLNDLDYVWPQGLACVGFELMNGGPDLEPEERQRVEEALSLPVRVIWRHI